MFDDSQSMHNFDFGWDSLMDILKTPNYEQINRLILNPPLSPGCMRVVSVGVLRMGCRFVRFCFIFY
jgi:hypothetical protein